MIDLHRAYGLSFIKDDSSVDVITFAAETWLVAKVKDQGSGRISLPHCFHYFVGVSFPFLNFKMVFKVLIRSPVLRPKFEIK